MTNEREIDILDLLAEMLKHWKGAIVCLLVGVIAFGAYDYMKNKPAAPVEEIVNEAETEDETVEEIKEGTEKALIDQMTFAEKKAVDIALEYEALYNEAKANGDVDNVITLNKVIIDSVKTFTDVQLKYFVINSNSDMWGDELALMIAEEETDDETVSGLLDFHHNKKKMIVCGVALFILYLAFFGVKYVLDGNIKATDDLAKLANIPELGKIYTVKAPKFFIDKGIFNMKYHGQKVMTADASIELIAAKISAKAKANDVSAITFVGCSLEKKSVNHCKKLADVLKNAYKIDSNIIDDIVYNKAAVDSLLSSKNLVIVEATGVTTYTNFDKEIQLIKQLEINCLGGVVVV